jgi:hypothetical protein
MKRKTGIHGTACADRAFMAAFHEILFRPASLRLLARPLLRIRYGCGRIFFQPVSFA